MLKVFAIHHQINIYIYIFALSTAETIISYNLVMEQNTEYKNLSRKFSVFLLKSRFILVEILVKLEKKNISIFYEKEKGAMKVDISSKAAGYN